MGAVLLPVLHFHFMICVYFANDIVLTDKCLRRQFLVIEKRTL